MCLVVLQAKYGMAIDNPAWTYTEQDKLEAFDTTLTAMTGELLQKCRMAYHMRKVKEYEKF